MGTDRPGLMVMGARKTLQKGIEGSMRFKVGDVCVRVIPTSVALLRVIDMKFMSWGIDLTEMHAGRVPTWGCCGLREPPGGGLFLEG